MCFFKCCCSGSSLPAVCKVSIVHPTTGTWSLELTSIWQHDGWMYRSTFHQETHRDCARETEAETAGWISYTYKHTLAEWQTICLHCNIKNNGSIENNSLTCGLVNERYRACHLHGLWLTGANIHICSHITIPNRTIQYSGISFPSGFIPSLFVFSASWKALA